MGTVKGVRLEPSSKPATWLSFLLRCKSLQPLCSSFSCFALFPPSLSTHHPSTQSIFLSIHQSLCLSINPSVCPPMHLSICPLIHSDSYSSIYPLFQKILVGYLLCTGHENQKNNRASTLLTLRLLREQYSPREAINQQFNLYNYKL